MRRLAPPLVFLLIAGIALAGLALYYGADRQAYVSSQNAELLAPTYEVAAAEAGRVVAWTGPLPGTPLAAGAKLGAVAGPGGTADVRTPGGGRLVQAFAYPGALVAQGQELALVADLGASYVLAYLDETDAVRVHAGQGVDVRLASGARVAGVVQRVDPVVAAITWPLPPVAAQGGTAQAAQWVPVRIRLAAGAGGLRYLGMDASVRIRIGGDGS